MSDTRNPDRDPIDPLLGAPETGDPAGRFADDLRQAASSSEPVRIDSALADLFAPPTPQPRRTWRPWMILRPAATVAAAFVAVLVLGAGAVALVGPQLVETITSADDATGRDVTDSYDDDELSDRETDPDSEVVSDREPTDTDDDAEVTEDGTDNGDADDNGTDNGDDREANSDGNDVNEEAVLAWTSCMEEGFNAFLEGFGTEASVPEGVFASCPKSDEGSLGVAGHAFKDALHEWMGCASAYGHETLKGEGDVELDVAGTCGPIPTYADFGIDVPDDVDIDSRDRTDAVDQKGREAADDDEDRSGEGRGDGRDDVRNGSSDEGRSPAGDRTGEG